VKIAIVGTGRVGTAIAVALKKHEIVGLSSREKTHAISCIKLTNCPNWSPVPYEITKSADVVFITVPDSKIVSVYQDIEKNNGFKKNSTVIHTSGTLSSDILKRNGRLSMHPIHPFTDNSINSINSIIFALEGDKYGLEIGKKLVKDLKGEYFIIPKEAKALYHSALNFGAAYLVALLQTGTSILERAGIKNGEKIILSLAQKTLNNIKEKGIQGALTGPIERGDIPTVKLELKAIKEHSPEFLSIYKILALKTLKIAEKKGLSSNPESDKF
jgi:predicted short-subunit dehydrogenase-like oxidoreductase (DUF2520 family)